MFRLLAAFVATTLSVCAYAQDVTGAATATFVNPQPSSPPVVVFNVGTNNFSWGGGGFDPINTLRFDGSSFAANYESPFKLGTLSYYNGLSVAGTEPDTVDLAVKLQFSDPVIPDVTSNFTLQLISTPNDSTPDANADFVKFGNVFSDTSFIVGATTYRVKITGFQNIIGDGFLVSDTSQFHVREGSVAVADLYGIVTTQAPAVPEPGTYVSYAGGSDVRSQHHVAPEHRSRGGLN